MKYNPLRLFWMILGFLCLGLGTAGILLPLLPTVPFYMATVFCFAKSSKRLHCWFTGTGLYKRHLASYVSERAMTVRTKLSILFWATLVMGTGFVLMDKVPAARAVLAVVWICHLLFLTCRVKTLPAEKKETRETKVREEALYE